MAVWNSRTFTCPRPKPVSNELQARRISARNSNNMGAQPASASQDRASALRNAVLAITNIQPKQKAFSGANPASCKLFVLPGEVERNVR
jgi:hypothetical protein